MRSNGNGTMGENAASSYVAANSNELILDSQDIIGCTATIGGIPGHAFTTSSRARDLP